MDGQTDGGKEGWIDGPICRKGRMDRQTDGGRMDRRTDKRTDGRADRQGR